MKISNQKYMLRQLHKEWEDLGVHEVIGSNINIYPPETPFEKWLTDNDLLEDE